MPEPPSQRGHALFDLDQTIVPWDSQLLFCNWILRRHPARRLFLLLFLPFLPLAGVLGAGGMKRVFLAYLLGMTRGEVESEAREFAKWVVRNAVYPGVLRLLAAEQAAGRVTVLTSASPEFYAKEIGRELGFDQVFGTRFHLYGKSGKVPLFPDLAGANNKGAAKLHRMREEGAIPPGEKLPGSRAYSDSKADLPLLELCAEAVLVNPSDSLAALGAERGWETRRPERPSGSSRLAFALASVRQLLGLFPV